MEEKISENFRKAIEHGRTDIVRSILDACNDNEIVDVSSKEKVLNGLLFEEGTPLLYAAVHNQVDLVRTLLNCGANPAIRNIEGRSALDVAINDKVQQIFIEELLRATAASDIPRVQQLLSVGISVNSYDSETSKNTPLHWAACYGNKAIVEFLLGIRSETVTLIFSFDNSHYGFIKMEITIIPEEGAQVNAENCSGTTPLHEAVNRNDADISEILLNFGANPLIQAKKGKFAGKTPYDISHNNSLLQCIIEKYLGNVPSKENKNVYSATDSLENSNYLQDNVAVNANAHQMLSAVPIKSSNEHYDISVSRGDSKESGTESPLRIQHSIGSTRIYELIWPEPKCIIELGHISSPFVVDKELFISIIQSSESIHEILDVWEISRTYLLELGCEVKIGEVQPGSGRISCEKRIECIVNPRLFNVVEGYQLHISQNVIKIAAGNLSGLHYAICTFIQVLRLSKIHSNNSEVYEIESVLIKDEPRFSHRGILLDISLRGRVPTLDYLLNVIDIWSSLKLSYIHLYSRLTPSCDWQLCYSRSEMITLDRYCRDRHLQLVPALDVDSNVSYHHLSQMWPLFQELLSTFPNLNYVHIGPRLANLLVQPSNLDHSLSIDETTGTDMSEIFEPFSNLQQLWHILNLSNNTTVLLCSNGLHTKGEFRSIPNNVILVEYGFQADYEFSEWTEAFRLAGANILPSSGTASYNSLAGCPASTYANTKKAIKTAQEQDSIGIIVAHWSGSHHLTSHIFAWAGYLIAAGLSWNPQTEIDIEPSLKFYDNHEPIGRANKRSISTILDVHIFCDMEYKIGSAILELGRVDTEVLILSKNQGGHDLQQIPDNQGSTLYRLLTDPDNVNLEYLSTDMFLKTTKQIKRVVHTLFEANPSSKFAPMEIQELQLTADLMLTACKIGRTLIGLGINPNSNMGLAVINLGVSNLPPTFRTDIANKMLALIEQYKGTWLQRHLPQGLQSSLLILTSALHRFVPES